MDMHPFQTSRLDVRPMGADDEALYCRLYSDPEVMRYIGAPLSAEVAARAFLLSLQLAVQPDPRFKVWVLTERATCLKIGIIALSGRSSGKALELGAMLLPQGQGLGFAVEAQAALLDRLFSTSSVNMVWSRNSDRNEAATRAWSRLGFLKRPASVHGGTSVHWEVSRQQWLALQQTPVDVA